MNESELNASTPEKASSLYEVGSRLGGGGMMEALLLMDMNRALLWMEYETKLTEREEQQGGWLSDHGEAMRRYDEEYMTARGKLMGESATAKLTGGTPCAPDLAATASVPSRAAPGSATGAALVPEVEREAGAEPEETL